MSDYSFGLVNHDQSFSNLRVKGTIGECSTKIRASCIVADTITAETYQGLPINPIILPNYYYAELDGFQSVMVGTTDIGPTFFTGGQNPGVLFTSGDIVGDITTDTQWTVVTPGLYKIQLVQSVLLSVQTAVTGTPVSVELDLTPVLNSTVSGFPRSVATLSHTTTGAGPPFNDASETSSQVMTWVQNLTTGDIIQIRYTTISVGAGTAAVQSRSIQFEKLD